jgi:hypothetical protein
LYESKQKGLGKKFTFQVRQKIDFIKKNPDAFAIRYDDIRTAVLDVFPFMIHYTIDKSFKTFIISSVLHTSRDPEIWNTDKDDT